MQEADADSCFTASGIARRGYARFGVLRNIRVQLTEIIEGFVLTPELHEGCERGVGRTSTLRISDLHLTLVFRFSQVFPALRHFFNTELVQAVGIHTKAEDAHINRGSVVALHLARIAETLGNLRQVGRLIGFKQTQFTGLRLRVKGAAVPNIGLRIVLLRFYLGKGAAGTIADERRLHVVLLAEFLHGVFTHGIRCAAIDNEPPGSMGMDGQEGTGGNRSGKFGEARPFHNIDS